MIIIYSSKRIWDSGCHWLTYFIDQSVPNNVSMPIKTRITSNNTITIDQTISAYINCQTLTHPYIPHDISTYIYKYIYIYIYIHVLYIYIYITWITSNNTITNWPNVFSIHILPWPRNRHVFNRHVFNRHVFISHLWNSVHTKNESIFSIWFIMNLYLQNKHVCWCYMKCGKCYN